VDNNPINDAVFPFWEKIVSCFKLAGRIMESA